MLPSGLPDLVDDEEAIARILRSSRHYSSGAVKAAGYMPASDGALSVLRHGAVPVDALWQLATETLGVDVTIHGAAICKAGVFREKDLEVRADEPPLRHANVVGWPTDPDPELQKSKQKEIALALASKSALLKPEP